MQAINGADKVHALRLDGNTIGADAAKSIAQALKKHPEFQVWIPFTTILTLVA